MLVQLGEFARARAARQPGEDLARIEDAVWSTPGEGRRWRGAVRPPPVDVIHHVSDVSAYFTDAHDLLRANGRMCTVTDSEAIIRSRRPLSEYWPETVAHELRRYPSVDVLSDSLRRCGFSDVFSRTVSREYRLDSATAYERRAFSSLHLIGVEEFERGLARLRADLSRGPIIANSAYVLIWGTKA